MFEKFKLLFGLLYLACKMLVMRMADVCNDTIIGMDYLFKFIHLTGHGDPGFKNRELVFRLHLPYRKRNTDL